MEKLVYLLTKAGEAPGADLRCALTLKCVPALRAAGASQISVNVDDEHVARGEAVAIRRSDPPIRAMVSFWMQNADDREPCEAALRVHADGLSGYLVVESRPLLHEPPVGQRAPGANLVTCIAQKPGISQAEFIDRWNNEHRKVAVETQSTFAYVRNAVVRRLTPEGADWDGIVEESFPIEALTDPQLWYDCSSQDEYKKRLQRMLDSVTAFLDLSVLESTPMSEYWQG
jgi:hypothetical protein